MDLVQCRGEASLGLWGVLETPKTGQMVATALDYHQHFTGDPIAEQSGELVVTELPSHWLADTVPVSRSYVTITNHKARYAHV